MKFSSFNEALEAITVPLCLIGARWDGFSLSIECRMQIPEKAIWNLGVAGFCCSLRDMNYQVSSGTGQGKTGYTYSIGKGDVNRASVIDREDCMDALQALWEGLNEDA